MRHIDYDNSCNSRLRQELKAKGVSGYEVARKIGVDKKRFLKWVQHPLDDELTEYFSKVIQQIALERDGIKTDEIPVPDNFLKRVTGHGYCPPENAELKARIKRERIYYRELGEKLFCDKATVCLWLQTPLSDERRQRLENAITEILEERQNLHERQ